jgi:hypothetical protein
MAARRLIALLVALLVISSIATALAPPPADDDETDSTSTTTTAPDPKAGTPEPGVVEAVIDTAAKESAQVEADVGDQLSLMVRSDTTSQVEIAGLGLSGVAAPGAPALFDVVLREEGSLEVTADGRPAGEIVVGGKAEESAKQSSEQDPTEEKPQAGPPKERERQASGSSVAA